MAEPLGTRAVLAIDDFRRLWMAQVVSFFGDAMTMMALLFLVQRTLGDATSTAGVLIAGALPFLLVGLVAGVWVDRLDRKHVMIWSDVIRAALVMTIPFVGADRIWLLYALVFVHSSVGTFFSPARTALVPRVVPAAGLPAANGLGEATRPVATVLGTAVAGIVVGLFDGFFVVFALDALTFLVSAFLVARIVTSTAPDADQPTGVATIFSEMRSGFRAILGSRTLLAVLMGGGVAMFGIGATNALMVPFVVGDLGLAETWFGLLEGAQTVGLVLAGASVAWLTVRVGSRRLVVIGLAGAGTAVAAFSTVGGVAALCALMFGLGLVIAPTTASIATILQTETPPKLLGRVASSFNAVVTGASVGSMAIAAALAGVIGLRGVFIASGAVAVLAAAVTAMLFGRAEEPVPEPA